MYKLSFWYVEDGQISSMILPDHVQLIEEVLRLIKKGMFSIYIERI